MSRITDQLRAKLDRNELEELQTQIRSIVRKPDAESLEAQLGKVPNRTNAIHLRHSDRIFFSQYGLGVDEAAGMRRPVQRFNCISCDRPIATTPSKNAVPGIESDSIRKFHCIDMSSFQRFLCFLAPRTPAQCHTCPTQPNRPDQHRQCIYGLYCMKCFLYS